MNKFEICGILFALCGQLLIYFGQVVAGSIYFVIATLYVLYGHHIEMQETKVRRGMK